MECSYCHQHVIQVLDYDGHPIILNPEPTPHGMIYARSAVHWEEGRYRLIAVPVTAQEAATLNVEGADLWQEHRHTCPHRRHPAFANRAGQVS